MPFRCIRHCHFHSCMSFLTTKEGMPFRCIRHCHFHSCMSFLTTKEGMPFRCIRHCVASVTVISTLVCLFWLWTVGMTFPRIRHYNSGDDISFPFFWLRCLCEKIGGCWLLGAGIKDILEEDLTTQVLVLVIDMEHTFHRRSDSIVFDFLKHVGNVHVTSDTESIDFVSTCRFWFQVVMSYFVFLDFL